MNLRNGIRGPWLGCSQVPQVPRPRQVDRGPRGQARTSSKAQLAAHDKANPIPIIKTLDGKPLTDAKGKPLPDAPRIEGLTEGEAINGRARGDDGATEAVGMQEKRDGSNGSACIGCGRLTSIQLAIQMLVGDITKLRAWCSACRSAPS